MNFLLRLLITAAIVYVLSRILSGVHIADFVTALIFALVLAVLNAIVKPLLILLTLPITVVTLGIFLFVINALIILLAARLVHGIRIDGFWWALIFSIILSIFSSAVQKAITDRNR
jgi:putative membrane protein